MQGLQAVSASSGREVVGARVWDSAMAGRAAAKCRCYYAVAHDPGARVPFAILPCCGTGIKLVLRFAARVALLAGFERDRGLKYFCFWHRDSIVTGRQDKVTGEAVAASKDRAPKVCWAPVSNPGFH